MNHEHKWLAQPETKAKYNQADMPVAENRLDDLSNKPEYLKTVRNLTQAKKYGYPDVDAIQSHTLDYYSVISEMDDFLGKLLSTVEELGLRENTYIFFMSDNGWMLGEHGFTSKVLPYQASTSVPLFVVGPDIKPGENNDVVLNIDFLPTILELADVQLPENIHGESVLPILQNKNVEWREHFIHEGIEGFGGIKPHLAVIGSDYRYIETYADRTLSSVNFVELYDMKKDPLEMNNLARDSSMKTVVENQKQQIERHKKEVLGM
jgi:arylsulfatase A-like enzyme